MPKRTDIESVLIIGAGPIIIGQACEFDYSGAQACKALKEEGYRVILVNSNPATIMTDPETADRTYIEPMTVDAVEKIIRAENPDALLPTIGGQTALNLAVGLDEAGVLARHGVQLIGANIESIHKAEDREQFRAAMDRIGLAVPSSGLARTLAEARSILEETGLPAIIRPSFTMGGTGGSVAFEDEDFDGLVEWALAQSPTTECLVERSVLGWKEYELEVMRDKADNVVVICSIENFDAMGVHTGDSITVAPAQTLTDREYQEMRDAAVAIMREIGVDTGGSNVQFGVDPADGSIVVIEMNPRVSRSSALASKATGFPIAKIAAKLAVGFTLDEVRNDITRETPASFEPSIDYVVTKVPRFTFEKFPSADSMLTTQMKSVGEVMAIGRTLKESLQKAIRSLEIGHAGFESPDLGSGDDLQARLVESLRVPRPGRLWAVAEALRQGMAVKEVHRLSWIDPWFLRRVEEIVRAEADLRGAGADQREAWLRPAKQMGFSDRRLADLWESSEDEVRALRQRLGVNPVYKRVDTCAAEFEAHTPYLYSTYEEECEARPTDRQKIMILGGGPNRIGQGIEFDYCCVHAVFALREAGFETIMVNCNPETVSTDYDTSDRLYFEPLTLEDVLAIVDVEKPDGIIVQFGGQTPLKLAVPLARAGAPIIGTSPDAIDRAEDRERFDELLESLGLKRPEGAVARSAPEAEAVAEKIGYPVLVRPSYVLGGRAMQIVRDVEALRDYMRFAVRASPEHPVLVDRFLNDAIEVDVDAICDGKRVVVGGMGRPLAKLAALVMVGKSLDELGYTEEIIPSHFSVKEAVFPFMKFPGVDTLLGPEMKSTGEVMGIDSDFGRAYAKAQIQAGNSLPSEGTVLVSTRTVDQAGVVDAVRILAGLGFRILATQGTAEALERHGLEAQKVNKAYESSPHTVDFIEGGEVDLVITTVDADDRAVKDSFSMRRAALQRGIPYCTTLAAARASASAIQALRAGTIGVRALQEIHARM